MNKADEVHGAYRKMLGDDFIPPGQKIEKAEEIPSAIEMLINPDKFTKGKKGKKLKKNEKPEEKKPYPQDGKARGVLKAGTKIYSTSKDRRYNMKTDYETEFEHKVSGMLTFQYAGDHFYVAQKDVMGYDSGEIATVDKTYKNKKSKKKGSKKLQKAKKIDIKPSKADTKMAYRKYFDNKHLGVSRDKMPQIDAAHLTDFLIHFSDKAKVKKMKRTLKTIKPTQNEINEEKVLKKVSKGKSDWKKEPYIISVDGYLLDGHHRWATGLEHDPDQEVDVLRVNIPMKRLIFRTNKMKISYNKDISDNLQKAHETMEMIINNPHLYPKTLVEESKIHFLEKE